MGLFVVDVGLFDYVGGLLVIVRMFEVGLQRPRSPYLVVSDTDFRSVARTYRGLRRLGMSSLMARWTIYDLLQIQGIRFNGKAGS